jgi:general secretion pathway protein G
MDHRKRTTDNGQRTPRAPARGFTMIELLIVVIIIAILIGLLLPAIYAAMRSAKNAAVSAEISQLSQSLENFKNRYGAYPPSRVILYENGFFPVSSNLPIAGENTTYGALAQQTLAALRQFFPKVALSTSGTPAPVANGNGAYWYDFNGNGVFDQTPYVLHGHECLVFFLGGIPFPSEIPSTLPAQTPLSSSFGMSGFGADPTNPFTNAIAVDPRYPNNVNPMYSPNRSAPMFEFNGGRLYMDPFNSLNSQGTLIPAQIPGYYDSLGSGPPSTGTASTLNFYAYFASYGNSAYNPDDINFLNEDDGNGNTPIGLAFQVPAGQTISASPNPYTSTLSVPGATGTAGTFQGGVSFQKPQTFQIISAGVDGLYGVGGQFILPSSSSSSGSNALPFDPANTVAGPTGSMNASNDPGLAGVRQRETDNLTNFKSGTLQ